MSLEIRDFREEDREFFLKASRAFYSSDAVCHPVPEKNFLRTFDLCLEGNPFMEGMIFLVDNQPAGFALLSFTYSNEVGGLSVLLEEAFILPEFRSHGIGTKFFSMIEELFVVAGKAKRLRLEVSEDNPEAKRLYKRLGYKTLDYTQMVKDFE